VHGLVDQGGRSWYHTEMSTSISTEWKVLRHGPLETLSDNLWRVTGAVPGMSLQRTMTIARRQDGGLVLHSAIAVDEPTLAQITALGPPAYLLVPNHGHRLDAPAYKKRFPALRVYTPSGGRDKVAEVVPVDGTYEDFPHDGAVRLEMLHGVKELEGAMIVTSSDGVTVVLNDAVMNMDRKRDPLGWLFTTLMGSAGGPRVSRFGKLLFVKEQPALRRDLERFAALPALTRLVVSHEKVTHGADAAAALRAAATTLRA
jgi:hypothetical protein